MGTEGARALVERAAALTLQTGNLLNWGCLRKKCPATPAEEVRDCIQKTLTEWSSKIGQDLNQFLCNGGINCTLLHSTLECGEAVTAEWFVEVLMIAQEENINKHLSLRCSDPFKVNYLGNLLSPLDKLFLSLMYLLQEILEVLECTVAQAIEKINPEERDELKVSVSSKIAKLFIIGSNSSSIRDAVDLACHALGVAQLDSVIIAPPPVEDGTSLSLEYLQPYWQELENLVQNKKIVAIGTSDLDKTLLEQLYLWAQVKPSSNQVNLASCCVMPPDLTAFAKEFDIQLLTHNDPKELLCEASFQEVLQESIQNTNAHEWIPLWLLRYSVIVKSRGIIKSKGYIMQAKRNAS